VTHQQFIAFDVSDMGDIQNTLCCVEIINFFCVLCII